MIAGTPRPASPTNCPRAPRNSTSDDGSDRVPSLSFSRWNSIPDPRSTRKQERPSGACASTRYTAHGGYEQNHLWALSSYQPAPSGSGRGRDPPEHGARRVKAKPFVAVELVPAVAERIRPRDVRAHVRAALTLC